MIKNIVTLLLSVMISFAVYAQNDIKAREEYTEAQNAYDDNNFDEALEHLDAAEKLLGVWSPRIAYLKIVSLDNMCNYASPENIYTKQQQKEVAQYLKVVTNKTDDKFKSVQAVDKKLSLIRKMEKEKLSEDYKTGSKFLKDRKYKEAASYFLKAADEGNSLAMQGLGEVYGKSDYLNASQSLSWYNKAATNGCTEAAYNIALYHKVGLGVKEDPKEAFRWFQVASDWSPDANIEIAEVYQQGEQAGKNCAQALFWFKKAAFQGEFGAYHNVGRLYEDDCLEDKKSYTEAMNWYKKGVEKGNIYCYASIARLYERGKGVTQNNALAVEWYKKGAELDDYPKQQLGTYYYDLKNFEGAVEWLTKYLDKEDLLDYDVAYNLGEVYYYGGFEKGIFTSRQDPEKAILYLTRAAKKNRKPAIELLVDIYKNGKNGFKQFKDNTKAKEWQDKLANAE